MATVNPSDFNHDASRPFDIVSQNLRALGALTIDQFLNASVTEEESANIPYHLQDLVETPYSPPPLPSPPPSNGPSSAQEPSARLAATQPNHSIRMQTVARLHQTCQRVFGGTDALKFEFLEEDGPNSKQCILTVTRPNGLIRSYKTEPNFSRKNEAKAAVAAIAIEMGAIDFILTGEPDNVKGKKGLVLAPLDAHDEAAAVESASAAAIEEDDPVVKEIGDSCLQWRAGKVMPQWVPLSEPRFGTKHGFALKIQLSPHSFRVYSSDTASDTPLEAKIACAHIALEQGVLDFIKFGNGQTQPAVLEPKGDFSLIEKPSSGGEITPISLQSYYEALPKPFPEPFGDKSVSEINAPAWLNTTIQAARGGKLIPSFIWITDGTVGLHGCLLRLDRPGESKSYMVDPRFPKRADAKSAVCLQAISQGVGAYIRAIGATVESRVTPAMRKFANEQIFPVLASEYHKIRPDSHPIWTFEKDRDAYGCSMKVEISIDDVREYKVLPEYRTKADAKTAVGCLAVNEGVIELLRFRGEPPPPDYAPFLAVRTAAIISDRNSNKRKDAGVEEGSQEPDTRERKRRRKGNKGSRVEQGDITMQSQDGASTSAAPHILPTLGLASRHNNNKANNHRYSWKRPRPSGSDGFGSLGGPAQAGRPPGPYRLGPRNAGMSTLPYGGGPQVARFGNQAPASLMTGSSHPYPPDGRLGYGGGQDAPYTYAPHPPPEQFQGGPYDHLTPVVHSGYSPSATVYAPPQYAGAHPASGPHAAYGQQYGAQNSYGAYAYSQSPMQYPQPSGRPTVQNYAYKPLPPPSAASSPVNGLRSSGYHPSHSIGTSSYPPQTLSAQQSLNILRSIHRSQTLNESQHVHKKPLSTQPADVPSNAKHRETNVEQDDKGQRGQLPNIPISEGEASAPAPASVQPAKVSKSPESRPTPPNKPETSKSRSTVVTSADRTTKSHVAALLEFCDSSSMSRPRFHSEDVTNDTGEHTHKVWVILGTERLELPTTFGSVHEGRERVAKQVLGRLRSQAKKGKETDKL